MKRRIMVKRCLVADYRLMVTLLIIISTTVIAADTTVFHIPRIEGISVDGSVNDWAEQGFCVEFLTDPAGRILPPDDFDVKFRLGWNGQGLLVLVSVRDDIPLENENLSRLWQRDCVEIFVAEKLGADNRYQLVIASGADPQQKTVRSRFYDWRHPNQRHSELTSEVASVAFDGGYVLEVSLPWENVGVTPDRGVELAFQLVVNDYDGESDDPDGSLRVGWFPNLSPNSRDNKYAIRLSDKPSEAVRFWCDRKIELGRCTVTVRGFKKHIGEPVVIRSEGRVIDGGKLELQKGRAGAAFSLDFSKYDEEWPRMDVVVGSKIVATYEALSTLVRILERYIHALGGRTVIEKLTTRTCTGKYITDLPSWKPPVKETAPLKAYAKTPDRWVTILNVPEGTEQNGFDGKVGWKQNPDRIEIDSRMSRSWMGYLINPQGPLYITDYFPGMILRGEEFIDGRRVYEVETTSHDEIQNRLYFDTESGLLIRFGKIWELQDYRGVDGVQFPFRIATSRKGGETYFTFERIEHNVFVDDGKFAIPDHGEVYADAFRGLEDSRVLPMLRCQDLTYTHEEMNVPCRDGRFLYDFIVEKNYKRGLEIGTFTGYSSLWMGLALQKNGGRLITIEIDEGYGRVAQQNFRKAGLDDVIDARINDAFEEIPRIEGKFDFVFIDAWKPDYVKFLRLLRSRMLPGGAIIAHNVTNHARDMREYLDAIQNDPDLETTFHEISVEGMSVSIVLK